MAVDVGAFLLGWLAFALLYWHATALDLSILTGALVLPSAVVAWWSAGWCYARTENKTSSFAASAQGAAWGGFFAVALILAVAFVGTRTIPANVTREDLFALSIFVGYMALCGSLTLCLLNLINASLFKLAASLPHKQTGASEA